MEAGNPPTHTHPLEILRGKPLGSLHIIYPWDSTLSTHSEKAPGISPGILLASRPLGSLSCYTRPLFVRRDSLARKESAVPFPWQAAEDSPLPDSLSGELPFLRPHLALLLTLTPRCLHSWHQNGGNSDRIQGGEGHHGGRPADRPPGCTAVLSDTTTQLAHSPRLQEGTAQGAGGEGLTALLDERGAERELGMTLPGHLARGCWALPPGSLGY